MAEAMIEFQSVTKQYQGGQPAVDALSMSIDEGSITVFVGPSGCGKTTSLRMINRMVEPTSGTITVAGDDVSRVPAAQLRRSMGYVMQSSGLLPHRSVLDNIATVPRLNGVSKAAARKRAAELLDVVGLASALGKRYPSQLSGGQQQRVGVARALAADPPVLLMDEPFSAVDPVVRDELQQELLRLQRELAKPSSLSRTTSTKRLCSEIKSLCSLSAASWPSTQRRRKSSGLPPTTSLRPLLDVTAVSATLPSTPPMP